MSIHKWFESEWLVDWKECVDNRVVLHDQDHNGWTVHTNATTDLIPKEGDLQPLLKAKLLYTDVLDYTPLEGYRQDLEKDDE